MAEISPMCSIMVASAIGIMAMMAVTALPVSCTPPNTVELQ